MTMISLQFVFLELLFGFPFHSEDKAVLCWFNIEISHCAKCHLSINHRRQTLVSSPGGHSKLDPNHVMTQTSSSSCACPHVVVFGLEKVGRCFGVLSVAPNWTTIPAPVRWCNYWTIQNTIFIASIVSCCFPPRSPGNNKSKDNSWFVTLNKWIRRKRHQIWQSYYLLLWYSNQEIGIRYYLLSILHPSIALQGDTTWHDRTLCDG